MILHGFGVEPVDKISGHTKGVGRYWQTSRLSAGDSLAIAAIVQTREMY